MVSRYVTNGPVKQEGICLLPPPHYRMMPPQRAENFPVSAPPGTYAPNQGNQGGNQGPGLRALARTGAPNQSSTPPNDIKGQLSQSSLNPSMFVSQVRAGQPCFPQRSTAPSQTPRMANHNSRQPQQAIYPTQQFVLPPSAMYINSPFYQNRPPPNFVQQPMYMPTLFQYPVTQPTQQQTVPFNYMQTQMISTRPGSISTPQPATTNPTQPNMSMPMGMANNPPPQTFPRQHLRRRANALPVIDPTTGQDRLNEVYEENSHPPSGESSARQTPQPASLNHNKEVQAAFAKQRISMDIEQVRLEEEHHHPHVSHQHHQDLSGDHIEQNTFSPQPPQPAVQTSNLDHIVQSSSFNALAKEFVSSSSSAKDTPIVSANCDAVEVTLPNKMPKDRESPVKGRKREQQVFVKEHKDLTKEPPALKETIDDKQSNIENEVEVKPKEALSNVATNSPEVPVSNKDSSKETIDKKPQKKEPKIEPKVPDVETSVESIPVFQPVVQLLPSAQDPNVGKSKQSAQRATSKQNAQQQNVIQKQPIQTSVPQPQPPKPSNKTHKKNEINQKGANKEGTDMDAFNDNVPIEVNSNVTAISTISDIINANSVPIANNVTAPERDVNVNNEINNKKSENNDVTIKPEPVKPLKSKIDVTDIVKEQPKPMKVFNAPETHDEPDRAVSIEKLVETNNEVNTKANYEDKLENALPYRDGQWTPANQSGSMVYGKDFLLALRNLPCSKVKPDTIPDIILADDRGRLPDGRSSMGGRTDFTNPPFGSYGGGKSSSQRGGQPVTKRNSQSKMMPGGKNMKGPMKVSISVKEDVKLQTAENAWRPARLLKQGEYTDTEDEKKTQDLLRKVRGVLNKLTPQKFSTLLNQIKSLKIDTPSRLQGVIDLVFEKAVDEPNFSVAYASMCSELALMQVPVNNNSTDENSEKVNFRKLLITRCQMEFEKQSLDESGRNAKLKEIEKCDDAEKKKDMQFDLEESDRRLRMKSVGNIRFIGELFKQQMLTINIMVRCLNNLLDNKDEESLECLCKLLTTIGKELESKGVDLTGIFTQMKTIADKKDEPRINSRIRFMLQDVIDLKSSKWVPRRQDLNPKTIEQIQKEADNEQINIQMMNAIPMTPRKDERLGPGANPDRKNRGGRNVDNDGWITSNRNNRVAFTVQRDKLAMKPPTIDEPLGSSSMFGSWGKGSAVANVKSLPQQPIGPNTGNMYAALENMEPEKRNIGPRSKDPYSSKGPSMERNYNKYEGRGSRSGSQHRSNEKSAGTLPQQRSTPATPVTAPTPKVLPSKPSPLPMSEDLMDRQINNTLDEYVSGNCTVEEYYQEISSCIPVEYYPKMIANSYLRVLEKSQHARLKTGELFAQLIKQGRIQEEDYCVGLEEILSQADDLKIDIPKFWDYVADIVVDLILEEAVSLSRLQKSLSFNLSSDSGKVLAPLFKLIISKKGPVFLHTIWDNSRLTMTDFVEESQVDSFIKDNQLEFLFGGAAPVSESNLSYEEIHAKLSEFFSNKAEFDEIISWITANVGVRITENKFIRTLATAIFDDSIMHKVDRLMHHNNLLLRYVDNNPTFELQCLYALQALIHKREFPQGALLSICNKLYELGTFSQESFISWELSSDPAEQEGKGVALKQLVGFFTQLKENDDEESSEEDA